MYLNKGILQNRNESFPIDKTRSNSSKKVLFFNIFDSKFIKHENYLTVQTINRRCLNVRKQGKENKSQPNRSNEKQPGYGDKKLNGPNRPAE